MRKSTVFLVGAALLALLSGRVFACSCEPGLGPGAECETAQDCAGNLVCDPDTGTCAEVSCSDHAECGVGAYCGADGDCLDNTAGGPCDVDDNCVGGQICRAGTCGEIGGTGDSCDSAEDCAEPLVCAPQSDLCSDGLTCVDHTDCGPAAHCTVDGDCERSGPESPCDDDTQCAAADRCLGVVCIPDECEGDAFSAEPVPANVMIAVDRSGSMRDNIGSDGSKWDVARDAVYQLLADTGGDIRFGLNPFPGFDQRCNSGDDCGPGTIAVDIGDNTATDIEDYLGGASTCSYGTPIAEDLVLLQGYTGLKDTERGNYIMLITDGQATCDDPVPEVAALLAQSPPVRTFVVGFGSQVDPQQLADMAEAGGTARAQSPVYYQADDAASLAAAFADIAGSVLGCEYSLVGVADDPEQLLIYFNGVRVPYDASGATGWSFNPSTGRLLFAGNACVALQAGVITDLTIAYGCAIEEPPQVDAGPAVDAGGPRPDGGSGPECNDRCDHPCGVEACLLPEGVCGPCSEDADCCPDSVCLVDEGRCLRIAG